MGSWELQSVRCCMYDPDTVSLCRFERCLQICLLGGGLTIRTEYSWMVCCVQRLRLSELKILVRDR